MATKMMLFVLAITALVSVQVAAAHERCPMVSPVSIGHLYFDPYFNSYFKLIMNALVSFLI